MIFIYYKGHELGSYDGNVSVTLVARAFGGRCNYQLHITETVLRTIFAEWQAEKAKALADLIAERDLLKDKLEELGVVEPLAQLDSDSVESMAEETL